MSYDIHITSAAERDISNAADYIEFVLKNPKAADDLLNKATERIGSLSEFPKIHRLVDDSVLASWGIRFISIGSYLAFFFISEDTGRVTVVRFLLSKSNWNMILQQGFCCD
ncbi:MAG: type II toxin-antitoxin system RelE/ParE family toxin [Lentihominibacter sp.]